jgi:PAS domain S-box-containing protein
MTDDRLRILVIDDDEVDRMMVRRALAASGVGAEFQEATDGRAAVELLTARAFDCALLDLGLPDMDGLAVVRAARAAGSSTPIIVLTGGGDEQVALELMRAGANDYLSKQRLGRDLLSHSVRHAVRLHRAQSEARLAAGRTAESERRFRTMADSAPVLVWVTDAHGGGAYFNQGWLDFTGRTPEQELGDGWTRSVHPGDLQRLLGTHAAAAAAREKFQLEFRLRRHDGEYRWVLDTGAARFLPDGSFAGHIGSCVDITERKEGEQRLLEETRRNEALYRIGSRLAAELDVHRLVQTVTDEATTLTGAAFGAFFYNVVDTQGERYTLYTISGVPREAFSKFPMPRNTDVFAPTFKGEGVVRSDDITKDPRYGRNAPRQGMPEGHLPVRSYLAAPVQSRSGEVLGGLFFGHSQVGVFTERDERLVSGIAAQAAVAIDNARLYQALRGSEDRLRVALEAAELGTWDFDPTTGRLAWDTRCKALFGLPPDAPVDYDVFLAGLHPDDRERADRAVKDAIAPGGGGAYDIEYRTVGLADGVERWIRASGRALFESGRAVRFIGTVFDISERKRYVEELELAKDAAEAANRAKDQFLAVLSHELRTPLTPVLSTVQALESEPGLTPSLRESIEMIRRNVELESRLIDDLLDLTRIAKGKLEMDLVTVDVHESVNNVLEMCREEVYSKGLRLEVRLGAKRHHARADSARLQQVFWNLIKNAVKFTPDGGTIFVRTADAPADPARGNGASNGGGSARGDRVVVEVRDTGIGIEPQVLPRIFDAFEQGERSITRRFGGLGLGLAISKALIDMQGGRLTADSAGKGRGAVFTVELVATEAPARAGDRAPAGGEPATGLAALNILLVDDHEDTARAMGRLLQRLGYRITTAHTCTDAVAAFGRDSFDLVISDIGLPDGSGLELMRELRRRREIRGIALSGFGMEEDVRKSKEAGFYEHLTKPINFQKLQAVIRDATGAEGA